MWLDSQQWTIASLATGAVALVTLLLAVATAHWLYLEERCHKCETFPGFGYYCINATFRSYAGLWQICTQVDYDPLSCIDITVALTQGLKKEKDERIDDQWRTGAVIEATRIQFPLTCLAVILNLSGFVCSILGNFRKDKKTIVAAVMYILSGLCLSVGVILYISSINDELSFEPSEDCDGFDYQYDWSFYLIGISFFMKETSAVISVKLFLKRNLNKLDDMVRIIPGLEEKLFIEQTRLTRVDINSQTQIW